MSRNRALQSAAAHVEQPTGDAHVPNQPLNIPAVCLVADLARILKVSRRQIDRLRQHGAFPIPELPSLDRRARWSGAAVEAFLRQEQSTKGRGRHRVPVHGLESAASRGGRQW
jgi:hypothetical protein